MNKAKIIPLLCFAQYLQNQTLPLRCCITRLIIDFKDLGI